MKRRSILVPAAAIGYLLIIYLLYRIEAGGDGANIKSVFDAFWYSLVTLTTVGYGDFYPVTPGGKILAFTLILASLGVLGYIIGKLTEHIHAAAERRKMGLNGTDFTNHVIIVGWNDFSEGVVTQLVNAGKRACVVTDERDHIDVIHDRFDRSRVFAMYCEFGNRDLISKAGGQNAAGLMPCLDEDTKNLIFILNTKKDFPNLPTVVTLDNTELKETFISAGVSFTISRNEIASRIVASYTFEPSVARFNEDLLASASKDEDYDILQYYVKEKSRFAGKTFGEVFDKLKGELNVLAIGLSRKTDTGRELMKLPGNDIPVQAGDYVVVMTSGKALVRLTELFGCSEGLYYGE
ncbi:MAG TPA: ion channel [Desulfomicrobiaceae bacterium]|nr:ion channel [Desulfomicrobiaceae bacterium]